MSNQPSTIERELSELLNRHSRENASDTPDYILAYYLLSVLHVYEQTIGMRTARHGAGTATATETEAQMSNPTNTEWLDNLLQLHLHEIKAGHDNKLRQAILDHIEANYEPKQEGNDVRR